MPLKIYSTLTRQKEEFKPLDPPKVGMYVCGVTVYDYSHIGHARSAIVFDVIQRYLRFGGYDVVYVRNFTDIDDKIIKRANELAVPTAELTAKFIAAFEEDMAALGLEKPSQEPCCTVYVPQMVEFIARLVEKGIAYPTPSGDVYYRVSRFPGYGKLSGKNIDELEAGARVEIGDQKESPMDFALWKAAKPGEPKWPSPWGEGRPGWHIECSVMSTSALGDTFDMHGGGKDLIFPHHENEIAQSEAKTGRPYARYWLHNGFANVPSADNPEGTKMSKSLGNFYTIRDVLAAYHPEAVKFFMLSTHYRNDVLFTEEGLNRAQDRVAYFYETLKGAAALAARHPEATGRVLQPERVEAVLPAFREAMDDDFNTQRAFGQLSDAFKLMNEILADADTPEADRAATARRLCADLTTVGRVLGLFRFEPAEFERQLKALKTKQAGIQPEEIERSIAERNAARKAKNWALSDRIRDDLLARGVVLKDSKDGTTWTMKS
ncbi:MAG: cysteine--tRNA ligase [Myxococcales bacterium]|nr:MAG: cysteine--tRNA ligase [Myxococcales bacterium]